MVLPGHRAFKIDWKKKDVYSEFTEKLPEIPHVPVEVLVIRIFVYA